MNGHFDSLDISVLVLIMVLVLMARFSGWPGWRPPRGPSV
jgi:hypothetical protein